MNAQPPPKPVNLLKELLFDNEARRLEELSRRLEHEISTSALRDTTLSERIDVVFDRAGTEERLLHSVAAILDGALREAEVTRHEQVSRAIAPLIVRTIKVQLRDSQDEMVDALYPITGRMVKSYVQAEINRLMIEINAKLGGSRPSEMTAGVPEILSPADQALAAANKLQVEEIFLVRRGSGDLIAHWERPDPKNGAPSPPAHGSNRDVMLSGYISGILSLSEEAFGASPGSFRTLSFSTGDRIFVRGAAAHLLAVRCSGSAPAIVEQVIDEVFLDTLERYRQVLASDRGGKAEASSSASDSQTKIDALLPEIVRDIEARARQRRESLLRPPAPQPPPRPSFGRLYALATVIALPFIAWGAWSAYQTFETVRVESAANRVLETVDEVAGLPPKIDVDRGGRGLTVSGFVPNAELRDRILRRLDQDLPDTAIRNRLGVLPKDAEGQFKELASNAISRAIARVHERLGAISDLSLQSTRYGATAEQALQLRRSLDAALDQSRTSTPNAAIGHAQLVALWQALSELDRTLSAALLGRSTSTRERQSPPTEDAQLAEASVAIVDRLGTSVLAALTAKVEALQPSAREEAEAFIRKNVLFFANNTDFRDASAANAVLDQIALKLRDNPTISIRVVGYTDEKGTQALNTNLAQLRADQVTSLLTERGIAANRIVAVGRIAGKELTRIIGPTSSNRRVEFETVFPGEMDGSP